MGPLPTVADEPALTHTAAVPRGPLTPLPYSPGRPSPGPGHLLALCRSYCTGYGGPCQCAGSAFVRLIDRSGPFCYDVPDSSDQKGRGFSAAVESRGKFVFGRSVLQENGSLRLPPQAVEEYRITEEGQVILFTGSKSTGGFCVTRRGLLLPSKLGHILTDCSGLGDGSLPPARLLAYKGRSYCWLPHLSRGGAVPPSGADGAAPAHAWSGPARHLQQRHRLHYGGPGPFWSGPGPIRGDPRLLSRKETGVPSLFSSQTIRRWPRGPPPWAGDMTCCA